MAEKLPKGTGTSSSQSIRERCPSPPPSIQDKKGNRTFTRVRLLGEGGFGRCYAVRDALGSFLAAKVVAKASLKSSKQKNKLVSEIKIHQNLRHSNVVQFKFVFEDDLYVYMMMEICENKTLVEMLKSRKRLTDPEVRFYMKQLFQAIEYLHEHYVIHRDIKLGNLFLTADMNLKVGDFGLATVLKHDGDRKKTICGTPNYIAPEVLFDTQNGHSFEVDIWSLGVVMYTMTIGKPPFQTKEVKALYKRIRDNAYEFPANVHISQEPKEIISALLTTKPECRPSIKDVLSHPFFKHQFIPDSIPSSALHTPPVFSNMNVRSTSSSIKSLELGMSSLLVSSTNLKALRPRSINQISLDRRRPPVYLPERAPTAVQNIPEEDENRSPVLLSPYKKESITSDQEPKEEHRNLHKATSSASNVQQSRESTPQKAVSHIHEQILGTPPSNRKVQRGIQSPLVSSPRDPYHDASDPGWPKSSTSTSDSGRHVFARSTNGSQGSSLARLYETLQTVLADTAKDFQQLEGIGSAETDQNRVSSLDHPLVFITKWIDYSNKYGLGYQLRDGSVGVYFNDSTSIVISADESHFEYLEYDPKSSKPILQRSCHTIDNYPVELKKKVTLLQHFRGYMQENLFKAATESVSETPKAYDLDFLTKYLRTKHGVVFRLSNQAFQLNLFDHTKLILTDNGERVTYINKSRVLFTQTLEWFLAHGHQEVIDRLVYCKDIIARMLQKRQKASQ